MNELTPKEVLIDLFGGADFDHEILDPEQAADLVIQRLRGGGFEIVDAAHLASPSGPSRRRTGANKGGALGKLGALFVDQPRTGLAQAQALIGRHSARASRPAVSRPRLDSPNTAAC